MDTVHLQISCRLEQEDDMFLEQEDVFGAGVRYEVRLLFLKFRRGKVLLARVPACLPYN